MEAILELVLSNIFWIALLVGGLISVFNRNKDQGEQQQGREQRKPQDEREIDWKSIFQQEDDTKTDQRRPTTPVPEAASQPAETMKNEQTSQAHEQYQQQMEELRQRKLEAEEKIKNIDTSVVTDAGIGNSSSESSSSNESHASRVLAMSKRDVMNGVIWSEVLGEPKARRLQKKAVSKAYMKRS
ncbi:hypothetical protein SAMN05192534_10644 [Alteribacillus persepolensis]|uniref:Uncharacterized protein n=1 Tax=Alteribacillus persepolensis TaxID=568899 RepID=A0A1G8CQ86_9BACI|nr:hypothetical protein [Alteribacillus persepolensis]SDH47645.1 hypothetical protein SAMN05192534_10644 [Alteribacillus persepolensis]